MDDRTREELARYDALQAWLNRKVKKAVAK
jgi:hypothetical protein